MPGQQNCPYCGATLHMQAPPPPQAGYGMPPPGSGYGPPPAGYGPPPAAYGPPPPRQYVPNVVVTGPGMGYATPGGSGVRWFVLIPVVLLLLVGGVVWGVLRGGSSWSSSGSWGGARSWNGTSPFECSGNDHVSMSNVTANVGGTAIDVSGNCHFVCTNCTVNAPIGVEVTGNGHAIFEGGTVNGATAVDASGNAHVELHGTVVNGRVVRSGNAHIIR